MKRVLKKSLKCILIIFLLMNLTSMIMTNYSFAAGGIDDVLSGLMFAAESIFTGLVGLMTWIPRAIIMALLIGLNTLISGFVRLGVGEVEAITGSIDVFVTPFHVFFNKIPILDVNFLDFEGVSGTVEVFRTTVAGWYYTIRLIAAMILAVILVYIGIRMAISTIASEKAMYKKMLVDWVTSLALLFLLHYIIIFVLSCNSAIVDALLNICDEENLDITGFIGELTSQALGLETSSAIAAMILYAIIIGQTISFIFAYVKRMLTVGFLIMIAPLITITYSIDRIGDGKAQALNTWLKEFSYNILIQPFHCILFASFASVAFNLIGVGTWTAGSSLAEMILAVACIQFIKTGEDLVKKIFGFGQASSLADMAAGTAVAMAAISKGGEVGKVVGTGAAKTRNFLANNSDKITQLTKKVDKNNTLTKRGERIAEKQAKKEVKETLKKNPNASAEEVKQAYSTKYDEVKKSMEEAGPSKSFTGKVTDAITNARAGKGNSGTSTKKDAVQKHIEKKYGKEGAERLKSDPEKWSQVQEEAKKEMSDKKEERRKTRREISGVAHNFMEKNGQKIAAGTLGAVTGLVGFGVSGSAGFLAASKFGSGLATGYLSNTNKTIQKEVSGAAQAVTNLNEDNPDFDIEDATYGIYATAQNGGFDKVEEKLEQILSKLNGLTEGQRQSIDRTIKTQLQKDPAGLNMDFLNTMANNYNITQPEEFNSLRQFATLSAEAHYANTINTATSAGRSVEDVVNAAVNGIVIPTPVIQNPNDGGDGAGTGTDDSETRTDNGDGTSVDGRDVRQLQQSVDENNRKIDKFNAEHQDNPIQPGPK